MEETIRLQDLVKTLRKRLVWIISAVILAVTIAGIVSYYYLTPIYQASTQMLINTEKANQQPSTQDIQTNLQLINTYNDIIKSPVILTKVNERLDLKAVPGGLGSQFTVSSAPSSQVLTISVQHPNQHVAVDIVNTTAEVFQEEIKKLMKVDNVNILTPAVKSENPSPIEPNPVMNMAIAAVIGLMLGVGITFLLEYLDTTVKTEQDVEELLGLPILGLISPIVEKKKPGARKTSPRRQKKKE